MTASETVAPASFAILRAMVAGDVFGPGDQGYDQARRASELAADQRPAVVVFPESVVDVVRAVRFARSQGLRIAPQATGHGALPLELLEEAMLLRTSRMRRVDVFPAIRTARAEAGAQWEDVTVPAGECGLAALVGNLTKRGRDGIHARRWLVLAGAPLRAGRQQRDRDRDRDPGWPRRASRRRPRSGHLLGGQRRGRERGGRDGARDDALPGGRAVRRHAVFPIERGAEILHAWRRWTDAVTDEVTSIGRLLRLPPLPEVPELPRGRAFAGATGSSSELAR
jgi:hypothetical protein